MPTSQSQFDADLEAERAAQADVIQKQGVYIAAVNAFIALPPVVDLTAEDATVQAGKAALDQAAADLTAAQGNLPPPPPGP